MFRLASRRVGVVRVAARAVDRSITHMRAFRGKEGGNPCEGAGVGSPGCSVLQRALQREPFGGRSLLPRSRQICNGVRLLSSAASLLSPSRPSEDYVLIPNEQWEEYQELKAKAEKKRQTPEKDGLRIYISQLMEVVRALVDRMLKLRLELISGGELIEREIKLGPDDRRKPDCLLLLKHKVVKDDEEVEICIAALCIEAKVDRGRGNKSLEDVRKQAREDTRILKHPSCTFNATDKHMDLMRDAQAEEGGLRVYPSVLMVGKEGGDVDQHRKDAMDRCNLDGADLPVMFLGHGTRAAVVEYIVKIAEDAVSDGLLPPQTALQAAAILDELFTDVPRDTRQRKLDEVEAENVNRSRSKRGAEERGKERREHREREEWRRKAKKMN